jgi:RNAse (barnase) inhibitor barstar
MHAPVFLANKNRSTSKKFTKKTKEDIQAVLDTLKERGMWSNYYYDNWSAELAICKDEALLHAWWDAITNGAMFELDFEELREMQSEGLASATVMDNEYEMNSE